MKKHTSTANSDHQHGLQAIRGSLIGARIGTWCAMAYVAMQVCGDLRWAFRMVQTPTLAVSDPSLVISFGIARLVFAFIFASAIDRVLQLASALAIGERRDDLPSPTWQQAGAAAIAVVAFALVMPSMLQIVP